MSVTIEVSIQLNSGSVSDFGHVSAAIVECHASLLSVVASALWSVSSMEERSVVSLSLFLPAMLSLAAHSG